MNNVSKYLTIPFIAVALYSSTGFSKLVTETFEDGSAFTGQYKVQESSCEKKVFNYLTGKYDLIPYFIFEGTRAGLKVDGLLHPLQKGDLQNASPNSSVTTNTAYLSSSEFLSESVIHFENSGVIGHSLEDYKVDTFGNITSVRTNTNALPESNQTCRFVRLTE